MLIQTMTLQDCWAMLARNNIARLACARDNQPYIVPLRVELDGDSLYGYATLGRKIEWMRTNPLVCVECEELTTDRQWASVIVFGRYEELPHIPENEGPRQVAQSLFEKHPMWWEPAAVALGVKSVRRLCSASTSAASPAGGLATRPPPRTTRNTRRSRKSHAGSLRSGAAFVPIVPVRRWTDSRVERRSSLRYRRIFGTSTQYHPRISPSVKPVAWSRG